MWPTLSWQEHISEDQAAYEFAEAETGVTEAGEAFI